MPGACQIRVGSHCVLASEGGTKYGPSAEETLTVYAAPKPGATTVVWVHGGSWDTGNTIPPAKVDGYVQCEYLQSKGFAVLAINYPKAGPLSPTVASPASPFQREAVEHALEWALAHYESFNGSTKLAIMGGSAGGNIGLMAALLVNKAHAGRVSGVVALSGPADMITLWDYQLHGGEYEAGFLRYLKLREEGKTAEGTNRSIPNLHHPVEVCVGGSSSISPPMTNALLEAASPAHHIDSSMAKVMTWGGELEELVPYFGQEDFAAAVATAGQGAKLSSNKLIGSKGHSIAYWGSTGVGYAHPVSQEVATWLGAL